MQICVLTHTQTQTHTHTHTQIYVGAVTNPRTSCTCISFWQCFRIEPLWTMHARTCIPTHNTPSHKNPRTHTRTHILKHGGFSWGCIPMEWLWFVGSMKLYVSFAKEPYKIDDILQKRPIIKSILLTVATPCAIQQRHTHIHTHTHSLTHMHPKDERWASSAPPKTCKTGWVPKQQSKHTRIQTHSYAPTHVPRMDHVHHENIQTHNHTHPRTQHTTPPTHTHPGRGMRITHTHKISLSHTQTHTHTHTWQPYAAFWHPCPQDGPCASRILKIMKHEVDILNSQFDTQFSVNKTCIYIYIHIYLRIYIYVCIYIYRCRYTYTWYTYLYIDIYIHICV